MTTTLRCETCGNDACSSCGEAFTEKPLHMFWGEDICARCAKLAEQRFDDYLREQGLDA